jgi:hypothetical protein
MGPLGSGCRVSNNRLVTLVVNFNGIVGKLV